MVSSLHVPFSFSPFVPCRTQLRRGRSGVAGNKICPGGRTTRLEGTAQPFIAWTDHKNLVYLQSAKLLNPRQARWTLFFTGFHFSIIYRPGSHYVKPDTLSQLIWLGPSLRTQLTLHPSCNLLPPLEPLHGKSSHRSKKHRNQATGMPLSSL